jgi:NAD-dependent dihydropyrimidine dehydrogenase PreA subunit
MDSPLNSPASVLLPRLRYLPGVATLQLDVDKCNGCRVCEEVCPHGVFVVEDRKARIVDLDACIECGACALNCQPGALTVHAGVGCASAIIQGWLTGSEPSCDCGGAC